MGDFITLMQSQWNSATPDSTAPTWNAITFGGSSGAMEIRWTSVSGGAANTPSATWPQFSRPGATAAVPELWFFSADTTGIKSGTYDGNKTAARVARIAYSADGTYAAAPTLSSFGDNTHAAPSAGTQPGAQAGSPIVNGHATDTTSTSYLKANMYGTDAPTGSDPAAGAAGTTLAVTSGTAGSVSPPSLAAWIATWQSLQGAIQFITHFRTPAAVTAGNIWFTIALFTGPNMSLGTLTPVITFTYAFV